MFLWQLRASHINLIQLWFGLSRLFVYPRQLEGEFSDTASGQNHYLFGVSRYLLVLGIPWPWYLYQLPFGSMKAKLHGFFDSRLWSRLFAPQTTHRTAVLCTWTRTNRLLLVVKKNVDHDSSSPLFFSLASVPIINWRMSASGQADWDRHLLLSRVKLTEQIGVRFKIMDTMRMEREVKCELVKTEDGYLAPKSAWVHYAVELLTSHIRPVLSGQRLRTSRDRLMYVFERWKIRMMMMIRVPRKLSFFIFKTSVDLLKHQLCNPPLSPID